MAKAEDSIGPAPGFPEEGKMVLSRSGQRPHFVTRCKKDEKFKCDSDCVNSLGICSHTVAAAQVHNQLSSFVAALKKTTKKPFFGHSKWAWQERISTPQETQEKCFTYCSN